MNLIYYVYSHVDPITQEVLYIGHGCRGRAWIHGSKRTCLRAQDHLDKLEELTGLGYLANEWVQIIDSGMTKSAACQLEQELIREHHPRFNVPQGTHLLKLTADDLELCKHLREEGASYKDIASELGVSTMTVYRAMNGLTKNLGDIRNDR